MQGYTIIEGIPKLNRIIGNNIYFLNADMENIIKIKKKKIFCSILFPVLIYFNSSGFVAHMYKVYNSLIHVKCIE